MTWNIAVLWFCVIPVAVTADGFGYTKTANTSFLCQLYYSGGDIRIVVKGALMEPIRKVQTATHFKKISGPSREDPKVTVDDLLTPCSPGDDAAIEMNWEEVPSNKLKEPVVQMGDLLLSIAKNKPTVHESDLEQLETFTERFGEEG